jgi:2-oxoglutarate ferredoxin oxidoreductase subunit beta
MAETAVLTKKDFKSDQEVRWCPGCGDYAILSCVQGVMAKLGVPKHDIVWVSGIGCSSRFPYYMDTYGFHGIHGRAPALASGVKTANPHLSVWIATGDGDGLSIGGNHLAHVLRRNVDVKILLFNNEIYGLTKGQYSPTSPRGQKTKTSPMGSVDRPFNPLQFALGCNATFVARTYDTNMKHMEEVLLAAAKHKGAAFVEILQNCVIFNDQCFEDVLDKEIRDDKTVDLRPGQKLVFGKQHDKGLRFDSFEVKECPAGEAATWDPTRENPAPAFLLAQMDVEHHLPTPVGVLRAVSAPVFDEDVNAQVRESIKKKGPGKLEDLIYAGDTWTIQ